MPHEECKGNGSCSLRPKFEESKVRLSTSRYVQLLVEARETDPACWPPGLERAAALVEEARAIEDACVAKWGDFDPGKLSRAQGRKYFEIQLALDALQEEADAPQNVEDAIEEARHAIEDHAEPTSQPASEPAPSPAHHLPQVPRATATPPAEGFFAAPLTREEHDEEDFFLSRPEDDALEGAWPERPPLQRGENYA